MQNKNLGIFGAVAAVIILVAGIAIFATKDSDKDKKTEENTTTQQSNNNSNTSDTKTTPTQKSISNNKSAENKNPGESINPVDKDKVKASDVFSYKLLDARKVKTSFNNKELNLLLVKLEVENISKWERGLSVLEVKLSEKEMTSLTDGSLKNDIFYPRSEMGVDLGGDVSALKPGEKIVGYYAYTLESETLPEKLYLNILNLGNPEKEEDVDLSKSLKVANRFTIK